ncbi:hypothetical protein ACTFIR_009808 [Dictyostelium discoideum]
MVKKLIKWEIPHKLLKFHNKILTQYNKNASNNNNVLNFTCIIHPYYNKIIERIRYIDINDRQCECHSSVVKLKAYRKELTELYESIGDRYNGYKNSSVVGCKNIENIKIIDKGDEYYKNGKFDDAHEQYIKAFMLCKIEDYDYHDGFSLISTILLKLSSSHYNQYCRSIIIYKNNDIKK